MEQVLERFIVRHSRELAKALDREGRIRFPQRVLDADLRNKYSANIDYQKIDGILNKMNFAFYDLSVDKLAGQMKLPDGAPISKAVEERNREFLKRLIKMIVIINIFKRLESSTEAFKATLNSMDEYIVKATRYAQRKGYFVPPALKGDPIFSLEEGLPTPEDLVSKPKYSTIMKTLKLGPEEIQEFVGKCKMDRGMIEELLEILPPADNKYASFKDRVKDVAKEIKTNSNNGIIIFSQYTATATYLHNRLRGENLGCMHACC